MDKTGHFQLFICRCRECGQLYFGCYREISSFDGDDDNWTYWALVTAAEANEVRHDQQKAIDLLLSKKRLVWHVDGKIYWNDGPEIGLSY